jgi:glycine cleavage system aminomethyltransferase T
MQPQTATTGETSPLDDVLRHSGAIMARHQGTIEAAHFGSAAGEAAACLSNVGIVDRSRRTTLEMRAAPGDAEEALGALAVSACDAWWAEVGRGRTIIRCERADTALVIGCLETFPDVSIQDVSHLYAAIALVGPRAREVLRASGSGAPGLEVFVINESPDRCELLTATANGPALWDRLLHAGAPMHIACVGFEAIEHLAASRLMGRGHPGGRMGHVDRRPTV